MADRDEVEVDDEDELRWGMVAEAEAEFRNFRTTLSWNSKSWVFLLLMNVRYVPR